MSVMMADGMTVFPLSHEARQHVEMAKRCVAATEECIRLRGAVRELVAAVTVLGRQEEDCYGCQPESPCASCLAWTRVNAAASAAREALGDR